MSNQTILKKAEKYRTLQSYSQGQYKEKASKFIGLATPCCQEEEAKSILLEWKNKYPQASHLCYAYRLGIKERIHRVNDDGEPSNSAGPPILGQIKSFKLTNVLIGVVRYYGGVKLGVGGLVSAYKSTAKETILNGKIITKTIKKRYHLYFEYTEMAFIMNTVKRSNAKITNQIFEGECFLEVEVSIATEKQLISHLDKYDTLKVLEIGYS